MRPPGTGRTGAGPASLVVLLVLALTLPGCGDGGDGDDAGDGAGGGTPTSEAVAPVVTVPSGSIDPDRLPGIQTGPAPWEAELDNLAARLEAIGLPALRQEGQVLDLHVLLSVEVDGERVTVPTNVGLNGREVAGGRMATGFVSAIHTHDDSGLVHVHSPTRQAYTLGQVFDVWGVRLTPDCVGGYCAEGGKVLTVLDDGEEVSGNPRELELRQDQRIVVRYGPPDR